MVNVMKIKENSMYESYSYSLSQNSGFLIKALRKKKGVSGEVLARFVGVSQQQISRYERGEVDLTLDKIKKICSFFNITIWDFMDMLRLFYSIGNYDFLNDIKLHYD